MSLFAEQHVEAMPWLQWAILPKQSFKQQRKMKKIIIAAILLLSCAQGAMAERKVEYTQNGTEFVQKPSTRSSGKETNTGCTWTDSKGVKYDIYMSANGRCYVYKISGKSGNTYKYYLPKEMDAQVAKQMKK